MKFLRRFLITPIKKFLYAIKTKYLINSLSALKNLGGLTYVDIGAAGELDQRWSKVKEKIHYIGFEPDSRSGSLLKKSDTPFLSHIIFPFGISNEEREVDLHLCKKPMCSSLLLPNNSFLERFPDSERFEVINKIKIPTKKLDDLSLKEVDFIKIDIQGAELRALEGGKDTLKSVIGMEIEVEFLPTYINQPLFGDISAFLNQEDFEFIDFLTFYRWERQELNGFGQCVWGDALFLRSPEFIIKHMNDDELITEKYLSICLLYNRFDLIDQLISLLPDKNKLIVIEFLNSIKSLRRINNMTRLINKAFTAIISFFGSEYRSHLTN